MKIFGFALLAMSLSASAVFAEDTDLPPQLLDVVLGETVTDEQVECIQKTMADCENVGLPVVAAVESEVEKVPGVARRRVTRAGMKSTGKNQMIKLAVPTVPLSEVEQLAQCVTGVMTKCLVTDYEVVRIETEPTEVVPEESEVPEETEVIELDDITVIYTEEDAAVEIEPDAEAPAEIETEEE